MVWEIFRDSGSFGDVQVFDLARFTSKTINGIWDDVDKFIDQEQPKLALFTFLRGKGREGGKDSPVGERIFERSQYPQLPKYIEGEWVLDIEFNFRDKNGKSLD